MIICVALVLRLSECRVAACSAAHSSITENASMSSTINTRHGTAAPQRPALLYPTLLIAGIVVIIVSMLGIAVMTGVLPQAQSQSVEERAAGGSEAKTAANSSANSLAKSPGSKTASANSFAKNSTNKTAPPPAVAAARCTDCGVVDSVRAVEVKGDGSGLGAVAGGVLGGVLGHQVGGGNGRTAMTVVGAGAGAYAGNEVEKNMKKNVSYEIRVRMDDNSYRTFHAAHADVGVGQRVKVRDGQLMDAG
jgi:outer membrane lipoprotein SlyB